MSGVAVLLLAALVALGLEATGAPPGGRKRVGRAPLAVVVIAAALVAAVVDGTAAGVGVAVSLAVFAFAEGIGLLGERAALGLLLGAGTLKLGVGAPLPSLIGWTALWAVVTAALSMRAGRDAEAEAAAKAGLLGLLAVLLGGLGVVVGGSAGAACGLGAVGLILGLMPLQGVRVDLAQGAPPSSVALTAPLALVALGPALPPLIADVSPVAVDVAIALGLFVVPLVALAQTSLRRLLGVLLVGQAVLPLVAARAAASAPSMEPATTTATLAAALGAVALAAGVQALPELAGSTATWEDASGQGRRHPWRAGLLVFAAAQACGLPPALGYVVRSELAAGLARHQPWMAAGLLVGAALAALPVVRLALFLFAKEPRPAPTLPRPVGAVIALAAIVAVGIVAGFVEAVVDFAAMR